MWKKKPQPSAQKYSKTGIYVSMKHSKLGKTTELSYVLFVNKKKDCFYKILMKNSALSQNWLC